MLREIPEGYVRLSIVIKKEELEEIDKHRNPEYTKAGFCGKLLKFGFEKYKEELKEITNND